ncbi:MAG: peptidoglycan-binding protein [Candidatus Omnitrophica bacterium]|nr:peptidoglycan-binding protein [Candidatus Omnitrophota bacterium]
MKGAVEVNNSRVLILGMIVLALVFSGCGKKQPSVEESLDSLSLEAFSTPDETKVANVELKTATQEALPPLPPGGPYRPRAQEIQTALKNAGYYQGGIDGKIGPKSKAAIESFQKDNNLEVDGKVGGKTWGVLKQHLSAPSE